MAHWGAGEWLGLIALAVAVTLGAPPIFQMIWGRPRIAFKFSKVDAEDGLSTHLFVHLFNFPVGSRFLSFIGVRRESANFHAHVTIKDASGTKVMNYTDPPSSETPFTPILHHLHAGPTPLTLEMLGASQQSARIYYANDSASFREFSPGTYFLRLDLYVGEVLHWEERAFVVTHNLIKSYWADS